MKNNLIKLFFGFLILSLLPLTSAHHYYYDYHDHFDTKVHYYDSNYNYPRYNDYNDYYNSPRYNNNDYYDCLDYYGYTRYPEIYCLNKPQRVSYQPVYYPTRIVERHYYIPEDYDRDNVFVHRYYNYPDSQYQYNLASYQ